MTPWTTACQTSLSLTVSQSLLKFISIKPVMPSNHLILCHPLLLLSSIFPSIRVFSNGSALRIRWPKYWSFSFNMSPSSEGRTTNPKLIGGCRRWSKDEDFRRKGQQLIWPHCHQARHAGVEGGPSRCHSHLVLEAPETG